jgi:hypothetical protein
MALLMVVPSKSNPEKTYEIHLSEKTGVVYCNCPNWKFQNVPPAQRSCKHLASFHAGQLAAKSAVESKAVAGQNLATSAAKVAAAKVAKTHAKAMKKSGEVAVAAAKAVLANPKAAKTQQAFAHAVLANEQQ